MRRPDVNGHAVRHLRCAGKPSRMASWISEIHNSFSSNCSKHSDRVARPRERLRPPSTVGSAPERIGLKLFIHNKCFSYFTSCRLHTHRGHHFAVKMSLNDTCGKSGEANTSDPLHAENNLKQVGLDVLCLLCSTFSLECEKCSRKLGGTATEWDTSASGLRWWC